MERQHIDGTDQHRGGDVGANVGSILGDKSKGVTLQANQVERLKELDPGTRQAVLAIGEIAYQSGFEACANASGLRGSDVDVTGGLPGAKYMRETFPFLADVVPTSNR